MKREPALEVERPRKKLRLRTNFSWMAAGHTIYLLSQWALFAIIAKFWNAEMFGQLSLALAVTAPITRFSYLGMRVAQATDIRFEYRFGDYFGLRSFCGFVAMVVIAAVIGVFDYAPEIAMIIALIGVVRVIEAQSDVFFGLFQSVERMDYIARSLIMRGPLSVALFLLGLSLTDTLAGGVLGMMAATLLLFLVHDLPLGRAVAPTATPRPSGSGAAPNRWRNIRPIWDRRIMARLAWQTLPLGLVAVLATLQINLPRYFIADHLGIEQLGYFAAMMYFFIASVRFMNQLGHSASARLAKQYADGLRGPFMKLLFRIMGFAFVLGGAGVLITALAGKEILTAFYTAEYAAYPDVFVIIVGAATLRFVATLAQFGISAARRFQIQFWNHVAITVIALGGSYLLIPSAGLMGAGLVTLLVAVTHVVLMGVVAYSAIRAMDVRPSSSDA